MYTTDMYEGMLAETVSVTGHNGDPLSAYFARPLGPGAYPGVVLIHHLPGWDEYYREATRRFAHHGYAAICPNLYERAGHGTPEDVAALARGQGGVPDDQVVGDIEGARRYLQGLPYLQGKVGLFGSCSGGRHGFLVACRTTGFDALVECWAGRIVMSSDDLTSNQPVAPIDYTADLSCPVLGLFGEEDSSPSPEQVQQHEDALKAAGKDYEFHMYPDAGHGFFYHHRPAYRAEQAVDGWEKVFDFLGRHLQPSA